MQTIHHNDGTIYKVERIGHNWKFPRYRVISQYGNIAVYADNENLAIEKARLHYAKSLGL